MPDILVTADGWLRLGSWSAPCRLGASGIRADKREGDLATPAGTFPLRRVCWRADRGPAPQTILPAIAIAPDDGWCDEPDHPDYNRPVKHPFPASAERMWREDRLYDLVVVIGHNDDPVVPGAGSAVFMHIAGDGPTAGCVALAEADLRRLLADIDASTRLIVAG